MGFNKSKRPTLSPGDAYIVQSLTSASTGTRISPRGLTILKTTATGDKTFVLDVPRAGDVKEIVVDIASTATVTVRPASTAQTFYGTTSGTLLFTTAGSAGLPKRARLAAVSSTSWAILNVSTAITVGA
jgi:hypothetical protein